MKPVMYQLDILKCLVLGSVIVSAVGEGVRSTASESEGVTTKIFFTTRARHSASEDSVSVIKLEMLQILFCVSGLEFHDSD